MTPGRMLLAALAVVGLAAGGDASAHEGGSNGYASIAVARARIRYSLTLWPATLPASVAEQITRARAEDPPVGIGSSHSSATRSASPRRASAASPTRDPRSRPTPPRTA